MLLQVFIGNMITNRLWKQFKAFFVVCLHFTKKVCGEQRRTASVSFILVSLAAAAYFKSNYKSVLIAV